MVSGTVPQHCCCDHHNFQDCADDKLPETDGNVLISVCMCLIHAGCCGSTNCKVSNSQTQGKNRKWICEESRFEIEQKQMEMLMLEAFCFCFFVLSFWRER